MADIIDYKVSEAEVQQNGVVSAPDTLTTSPTESKKIFDKLPAFIVTKYNQLIDYIKSFYPSKAEVNTAINQRIVDIGSSDMTQAIYDPTGKRKDIYSTFSNPNILINGCFKSGFLVNQRGITTTAVTGNTLDCWKLVSGTVTVTDVGIVLNGTLSQILETAAGTNVVASCSSGTCSYDNATKTFTLIGTGQTIEWAKLEYGTVATPFVPRAYAEELLKCQRYYVRLNYDKSATIGTTSSGPTWINIQLSLSVPMRIVNPLINTTCNITRLSDSLALGQPTNVSCIGTTVNIGFSKSGTPTNSYVYAGQAGYIEIVAEL